MRRTSAAAATASAELLYYRLNGKKFIFLCAIFSRFLWIHSPTTENYIYILFTCKAPDESHAYVVLVGG